MAISNPDDFDEAVQGATRLESFEKSKKRPSLVMAENSKEVEIKEVRSDSNIDIIEEKINTLWTCYV